MEMYFQNKNISNYFCVAYENAEIETRLFQVEMMEANSIHNMICPKHFEEDGKIILCYKTDASYILEKLLQRIKPDGAWVRIFVTQLIGCIMELPKYLLDVDDIVLNPKYMFYDFENTKLKLVLVPGYQKNIRNQIKYFLEYLMPIFDYRDRQGFLFLCQVYDVILSETIPIARMIDCGISPVEADVPLPVPQNMPPAEDSVAQNQLFRLVPLTNGSLEDLILEEETCDVIVGRGKKEANYRIKNAQISRIHARIEKNMQELWVEDLQSTNGTFLNAVRMESGKKAKLNPGDIVGFANEEFFVS